jgi:hypothetical protein
VSTSSKGANLLQVEIVKDSFLAINLLTLDLPTLASDVLKFAEVQELLPTKVLQSTIKNFYNA